MANNVAIYHTDTNEANVLCQVFGTHADATVVNRSELGHGGARPIMRVVVTTLAVTPAKITSIHCLQLNDRKKLSLYVCDKF